MYALKSRDLSKALGERDSIYYQGDVEKPVPEKRYAQALKSMYIDSLKGLNLRALKLL